MEMIRAHRRLKSTFRRPLNVAQQVRRRVLFVRTVVADSSHVFSSHVFGWFSRHWIFPHCRVNLLYDRYRLPSLPRRREGHLLRHQTIPLGTLPLQSLREDLHPCFQKPGSDAPEGRSPCGCSGRAQFPAERPAMSKPGTPSGGSGNPVWCEDPAVPASASRTTPWSGS